MTKVIGKDNIALEKGKQSALMKAVKKVKKGKPVNVNKEAKSSTRGIIMLNHVPHGFYEDEMRNYFSQFGKVLRVRVARSKKSGKSRGYAYVEFEFREVAQIAADAMNNYLMFERLIKCELLPPTVIPRKIFRDKYVKEDKYPKLAARKKRIAGEDVELTEEESKDILQQRLDKLKERNQKLAEMGINYQFNPNVKECAKKTPAKGKKKTDLPRISPKMLRSRKSEAATTSVSKKISKSPELMKTKETVVLLKETTKKTPAKSKTSDLPRISPKMLRSRKSEAATTTSVSKKISKSPELLKTKETVDRKEATKKTPAKGKGKIAELPKFSPKLLRSRKSDASALTPLKEKAATPSKSKKAGRKSVF